MSGEDNILKLVEAEPAGEDYRLQDQVGFVLRKAHQRHVAIFASQIADLTPPQFAALAKLADVGETSQNQLGALVAMDAATIKGVIDRLKPRPGGALPPCRRTRRLMVISRRGAAVKRSPLARSMTAETAPLTAREAETLTRLLAKIA